MSNNDANDAIREAESFCKPMTEDELAKQLIKFPHGATLALQVGVCGLYYNIPIDEAACILELIARYYRESERGAA